VPVPNPARVATLFLSYGQRPSIQRRSWKMVQCSRIANSIWTDGVRHPRPAIPQLHHAVRDACGREAPVGVGAALGTASDKSLPPRSFSYDKPIERNFVVTGDDSLPRIPMRERGGRANLSRVRDLGWNYSGAACGSES